MSKDPDKKIGSRKMGRNKNGGSVTVNAQLSDFTGLSCCSAYTLTSITCVVSEEV